MAEGVQLVTAPARLIPDLDRSIAEALTQLQGEERNAIIGVVTVNVLGQKTAHVGIVVKLGDQWTVKGWIGTSGTTWGDAVEGAGYVKLTW